jgi:hypothetical protein
MNLNQESAGEAPTDSSLDAEAFPNFGMATLYMLARGWVIRPDWPGGVSRLTGSIEVPEGARGHWQWSAIDASSPGTLHLKWDNGEEAVRPRADVFAQLHEFRKRRAQRATEERLANAQVIEAVVRAVIERVRWFRSDGPREWPVTVTVSLGSVVVRKLDQRIEFLDSILRMWLTRDDEESEVSSRTIANEKNVRVEEGLALELGWHSDGIEAHELAAGKNSDRMRLFLRQECLLDEASALRTVDSWFLSCADLDMRTRGANSTEMRQVREALWKLQAEKVTEEACR